MGYSTGNADKKLMKTDKNDKTKEKHWIMLRQKGKSKTTKNNNKTCGNKSERTGERRKIKKILMKSKTIQPKQDIPKQRKKILPTNWGK